MRDNITRGNMDDKMAAKWFPFIGTLFLFIWFSNLIGFIPLPTAHETFNVFGLEHPDVRDLRGDGERVGAAGAGADRLHLLHGRGHPRQGLPRLPEEPDPGGRARARWPRFIFVLELLSNLMRIVSLSVRLFANMLAGHLIILFMAGGLAIILGIAGIGVFLLPLGSILYLFEVGLVATLQAFIFATLSAIYIGGAVAESH